MVPGVCICIPSTSVLFESEFPIKEQELLFCDNVTCGVFNGAKVCLSGVCLFQGDYGLWYVHLVVPQFVAEAGPNVIIEAGRAPRGVHQRTTHKVFLIQALQNTSKHFGGERVTGIEGVVADLHFVRLKSIVSNSAVLTTLEGKRWL